MRNSIILVLIMLSAVCADAATISVGLIQEDRSTYQQVRLEGNFRVGDTQLTRSRITASGRNLAVDGKPGQLAALTISSGVRTIAVDNAKPWNIQCPVRLTAANGRIAVVMMMDLEDYTSRAVAAELPSNWPVQALAAQAVVSRSYAAAAYKRHGVFDVCTLTHCQRISNNPANGQGRAAAAMTHDVVIKYGGAPMMTPFCSTCGGHTVEGRTVGFSGAVTGVKCGPADSSWCKKSPHFRWTTTLTTAEGRLIGNTNMQGWPFALAAGRTLGWNRVKSGTFEVSKASNGWKLDGKGLGHGAGLCQWGAKGMAEHGKRWNEIVKWYFPEGKVQRL